MLSSTVAPRSRAIRPDDREHLALPGRVEAERRLVEEDDLGIVDERAGDAEPLPHPAAVGGDQRRPRSPRPTSSSSAPATARALAREWPNRRAW